METLISRNGVGINGSDCLADTEESRAAPPTRATESIGIRLQQAQLTKGK